MIKSYVSLLLVVVYYDVAKTIRFTSNIIHLIRLDTMKSKYPEMYRFVLISSMTRAATECEYVLEYNT